MGGALQPARNAPSACSSLAQGWRGSCNSLCDMLKGARGACSETLLDRLRLLRQASQCQALTDVALTKANLNCRGFSAKAPVSMLQHGTYTYLLHVDGNGFSGRLEELLTLGGAVIKEDSPFQAFYYPLLRRGEHYVPVERNFSSLCMTLHLLRADRLRTAAVALAGERFARAHLSQDAVMRYVAALVRGYANLQRFQPRQHPNAQLWKDPLEDGTSALHARYRDRRQGARISSAAASPYARAGSNQTPSCPLTDLACCRRHPRACRRSDPARMKAPTTGR